MKYYVVETDRDNNCPEVKATYTNKARAIKDALNLRKIQSIANEMWNEKRNNKYLVTTSTDWEKDVWSDEVWFDKVPQEIIIFKA